MIDHLFSLQTADIVTKCMFDEESTFRDKPQLWWQTTCLRTYRAVFKRTTRLTINQIIYNKLHQCIWWSTTSSRQPKKWRQAIECADKELFFFVSAFELWFKQTLADIDRVRAILQEPVSWLSFFLAWTGVAIDRRYRRTYVDHLRCQVIHLTTSKCLAHGYEKRPLSTRQNEAE